MNQGWLRLGIKWTEVAPELDRGAATEISSLFCWCGFYLDQAVSVLWLPLSGECSGLSMTQGETVCRPSRSRRCWYCSDQHHRGGAGAVTVLTWADTWNIGQVKKRALVVCGPRTRWRASTRMSGTMGRPLQEQWARLQSPTARTGSRNPLAISLHS